LLLKSIFREGTNPYGIAAADIDGDGKTNIAVTNGGGFDNFVSLYRNVSIGTTVSFAPKVDFAVQFEPQSVAIGDWDGDNKPEVAVANYGSSTVFFKNVSVMVSKICQQEHIK
jgi:hypothetical protein